MSLREAIEQTLKAMADLKGVKMTFGQSTAISVAAQALRDAMTEQQLRLDFERVITDSPYELPTVRWPNDHEKFAWPDQYKNYQVELAWSILNVLLLDQPMQGVQNEVRRKPGVPGTDD